ncbi:MAG: hypothetical protein HY554_15200 [Elusimicrobia bacterium]|nr:hypothetical protein [Elusimicrobiota bacterium]
MISTWKEGRGFLLAATLIGYGAGRAEANASDGEGPFFEPAGATKCVISMASCPRHPRMYAVPAFIDADYLDGNPSNRSAPRCLDRAQEYHAWCGSLMPVRATFYEDGRAGPTRSAGGRSVRVDVSLAQRPLPAFYDTDPGLGTQNGWAPGAPRLVANAAGAFAVLLRGDSPSRNELRFDLVWRPPGSGGWKPIASRLGPAVSDPILLTDPEGRLHVLFPGTRACGGLTGKGNIVHQVFWRGRAGWRSRQVLTAGLWTQSPSDCDGYPRAERLGGALDERDRSLQLVFYDLAGKGYRVGFASFDLDAQAWSPMKPVPGTGLDSEGAGYSYVAPGSAGAVSFITTNFNDRGYHKAAWLRSSDGGATWSATVLCDSVGAGRHACLSGDILQDSRGRAHLMFQIDAGEGGATPLESTGLLAGRRASYLLSSDRPGEAYPIVDQDDPEGPSPDWAAALGQLGDRLVAIGPIDAGGIGLWVSKDFGMSWRFKDLTPELPPGIKPFQFRLDKRQHGSRWSRSLSGMYTALADGAVYKTFDFELHGLELGDARDPGSGRVEGDQTRRARLSGDPL